MNRNDFLNGYEFLYHITLADNYPLILKHGLIPKEYSSHDYSKECKETDRKPLICLATNTKVRDWIPTIKTNNPQKELYILKINVQGIKEKNFGPDCTYSLSELYVSRHKNDRSKLFKVLMEKVGHIACFDKIESHLISIEESI